MNRTTLAAAVGVTERAVYAWEMGTLPSTARLGKLAEVLGCEVPDLFTPAEVAP